MRVVFGLIFLLTQSFIFQGCNSKEYLTVDEFKEYQLNPQNGLLKLIKKDDLTIRAIYKPRNLLFLDRGIDEKNEINNFNELQYFIINISDHEKEVEGRFVQNSNEYKELITYLSSGMSSDVILRIGSEIIHPIDMRYTPSYGSSNGTSVLFVFRDTISTGNENLIVEFNDKVFGVGQIEFEFDIDDIIRIPQIRI